MIDPPFYASRLREPFQDPSLGAYDRLALLVMMLHANTDGVTSMPSRVIAGHMASSRPTVTRSLKRLTDLGYIEPHDRQSHFERRILRPSRLVALLNDHSVVAESRPADRRSPA